MALHCQIMNEQPGPLQNIVIYCANDGDNSANGKSNFVHSLGSHSSVWNVVIVFAYRFWAIGVILIDFRAA